ncbi:MAG: hypothetical protein M3Z96_00380 [Pseudomonadota bacterium]|nr:hypothetical protein [Pseudomonadota bacterium]
MVKDVVEPGAFSFGRETADRMAMLEAAGSTPLGEPLRSFGEWGALKAICK